MAITLLENALESLRRIGGVHGQELLRDVHALYVSDVLFALVTRDTLYFKADHRTLTRYLARGTHAFRPSPQQTLRSFYAVPAEVMADEDVLLPWAVDAIESAKAHPGRMRRRIRKPGSRSRGRR
jgi:DNA transformation protein